MATDFEKVEAETKTSENVTLDSEAQQSREAGKQLAEEGGGNSDLLAVARSMEQAARKQKNLTTEADHQGGRRRAEGDRGHPQQPP